jgi:predicted transcriptional regulator
MTARQEIKDRRKELGLSQVKLTNAARVSRFRFTLWEAGDGDLTNEEPLRVEAALQLIAKSKLKTLSALSEPG